MRGRKRKLSEYEEFAMGHLPSDDHEQDRRVAFYVGKQAGLRSKRQILNEILEQIEAMLRDGYDGETNEKKAK